MGKKKRKNVPEDPILKITSKKVKPNKQESILEKKIQIEEEEKSDSSEIEVSDIEQDSVEQDNFQKFLSTFNISNNE